MLFRSIQPDHVGAGNLYSKEYFTLLRKGLAPGGIVAQWAERGKPKLYPYIVRTFLDAFPHVSFWCSGRIMLGSNEPLDLNRERLARNLADPTVANLFADLGILSVDDLLAHYTGDDSVFRQSLGPSPVVSDDRPVTEYFRVLPDGDEPGLAKLPPDGKSCPLLARAG